MPVHYEDLWVKCEEYHKELSKDSDISDIINEITMKFKLYETVSKIESSEEKEEAKFRLMGEILLSLTALSMKDNIDVYDALQKTLMYNNIDFYSNKYSG